MEDWWSNFRSIVQYEAWSIFILNRLDRTRECDGRTDRQTDRQTSSDSKCRRASRSSTTKIICEISTKPWLHSSTVIIYRYKKCHRPAALAHYKKLTFLLPRCMECRRGLAMRKLSVCLSVCPSVKRVHCDKMEEISVQSCIPYTIPEILFQPAPFGTKPLILNRYSLVALHP